VKLTFFLHNLRPYSLVTIIEQVGSRESSAQPYTCNNICAWSKRSKIPIGHSCHL